MAFKFQVILCQVADAKRQLAGGFSLGIHNGSNRSGSMQFKTFQFIY